MKNHTIRRPVRSCLVLLFLLVSIAAFWSGLFTLSIWDDLWNSPTYQNSRFSDDATYIRVQDVQYLIDLQHQEQAHSLTYSQKQSRAAKLEMLRAENTNFRYQVHDVDGNLLLSNLDGADISQLCSNVSSFDQVINPLYTVRDDYFIQGTGDYPILIISTTEGQQIFDPASCTQEMLAEAQRYGWIWVPELPDDQEELPQTALSGTWNRAGEDIRRNDVLSYTVEYGLTDTLAVDDLFAAQAREYGRMLVIGNDMLPVFGLSTAAALALFLVLMRSAGWQKDADRVYLRTRDRWWYELYLTIGFFALWLILWLGDSIAVSANLSFNRSTEATLTLGLFSLLLAYFFYLLADTTAVRLKAHQFWQTTLLHWCWRQIRRFCSFLWSCLLQVPLYGRVVVLFLLYLLGSLLSGMLLFLIPIYQGAVLYAICRWVKQWRTIRSAAGQMAEGDVNCQIDTDHMYPALKEHAGQLNSLSEGLNKAVNERMKSEHFKSELITNVSHDLKTPLTSIINYVDLLKKTEIQDPKAREYIEVLDRKSQRLKKLTEDLVEASKASTGNLTVNREHLNVGQLADQALAEYADRLAAAELTPVVTLPEESAYISADGRHLWRVIDNLLSNCCKYAMPGTRVYLDVSRWDSQVILSVKNISREPLNVPAESLMERFVRGDASRTTEGSGLGLSIARSLTELQGGSFRLSVDGDLFKAVVTFPEDDSPRPVPLPEVLP